MVVLCERSDARVFQASQFQLRTWRRHPLLLSGSSYRQPLPGKSRGAGQSGDIHNQATWVGVVQCA